jgi:hypothetical protein
MPFHWTIRSFQAGRTEIIPLGPAIDENVGRKEAGRPAR